MTPKERVLNPEQIPESIFLPPEEQEDYFKEHNLSISFEENGMVLGQVYRRIGDSYNSSVSLEFTTGARLDPTGKTGISHLAEHLIANRAFKNTHHYGIKDSARNARTSYKDMLFWIEGTSNPSVQNFGLWPTLPNFMRAFESGFTEEFEQSEIQNEVKVIKAEIREHENVLPYRLNKFLNANIWGAQNPINTDVLGSSDDLDTINARDISTHLRRLLDSNSMTVRVISEGPHDYRQLLHKAIENGFTHFRPAKPDIEPELLEAVNSPDSRDLIIYEGVKYNEPSILTLAWRVENPIYSPEQINLGMLMPLLNERVHSLMRREGWGYSSNVGYIIPGKKSCCVFAQMTLPEVSPAAAQELQKRIQEELLSIPQGELERIVAFERLSSQAIPVSQYSRMEQALLGLKYFGRIIDIDRLNQAYEAITPADLDEIKNKIVSAQPLVLLF